MFGAKRDLAQKGRQIRIRTIFDTKRFPNLISTQKLRRIRFRTRFNTNKFAEFEFDTKQFAEFDFERVLAQNIFRAA